MTEAELKEYRERLLGLPDEQEMIAALFAHIDTQAAELTDREGKYVDLLRTKHALEAEVERLKGLEHSATERISYISKGELKKAQDENDSLRALVREADGIIYDAYYSHYDARLDAADRCPWCKRAAAWQKKACA